MSGLTDVRFVAVEKVSSVPFLQVLASAWCEGEVVIPTGELTAVDVPGVTIDRRVAAFPGGGWFDEPFAPDDSPEPAQITFTSGTTGAPKPVLLSRRALSDVATRLIDVMRLDADVREYVGVPVTFSFGLGRVRTVTAAGGRCYLPPQGFRVDELAAMLADGRVNALSLVPTLLRFVIQQRRLFEGVGGRLRWLEIGSQPMSGDEKAAVREIFPEARIVQHYGLTEASRSTFLSVAEAADGPLESVGRPNGRVEVRVDSDGRIRIRGPHVADGVLTRDGVAPLTDPAGWLRTNDLGFIDSRGFLHYQGRADHLINVGGVKVPAELFEQRLAERIGPDGLRIAVAGRPDPLRGEAVGVAHLPGVAVRPLAAHARAVAAEFGLAPGDVAFSEIPEIPRTETGKVRRGDLTGGRSKSIAAVKESTLADSVSTRDDPVAPDRQSGRISVPQWESRPR